jgi:pyruvate kinase
VIGFRLSVVLQDGSEWIFTNRRADEAHQFTMHVNFDKFSEGLKMRKALFLVSP